MGGSWLIDPFSHIIMVSQIGHFMVIQGINTKNSIYVFLMITDRYEN
jgi:hypothetical protein